MNLIEIRPPKSMDEYQDACSLVESVYQEHGMTAARRLTHPKAIFVAVQSGIVLGSVGLRSADLGSLPSEYFYGFDVEKACVCSRADVAEIVKLAARERADHAVFRGLIAACVEYTFAENRFARLVAIAKPKLERALNCLLHIPSWAPECQLVHDRALAENPRYFLEDPTPRPICFLSEDYPTYAETLPRLLKGKATVDIAGFDHRSDYSVPETYERYGHGLERIGLLESPSLPRQSVLQAI